MLYVFIFFLGALIAKKTEVDSYNAEVEEFNAGYDAAMNGKSIKDEPYHTPYDVWCIGWVWGDYCQKIKRIGDA